MGRADGRGEVLAVGDARTQVAGLKESSEKRKLVRTGVDKGKGLYSISPKQPSTRRRRDWYPYYAGYTQMFVEAVIGEYPLRERRS